MKRAPWILFFVCLLVACDSQQNKVTKSFDHVADGLMFVRPVASVAATFPQAPAISENAQENIRLQRAFFSGDFSVLDTSLNQAHEHYVQGQVKDDAVGRFIDHLKSTQLAGIGACEDWIAAYPASYAAHWICGAMWHEGAWIARSHQYVNKIKSIRFALMRERFKHSDALLQKAITLSPRPVEALTLLAINRFMSGDKELAEGLLQQAREMMPGYGPLYGATLNYSLPEWGGSPDKIAQAMKDAQSADIDQDLLLYFHDEFVARPEKSSNPGDEKAYWEQAIAEKPTFYRLKALVEYYRRVQNWRDTIPAASRLIEAFPDDAEAYWMRADAYEKLGNIPAALTDYRMAAAQGDNYAIQSLIQAYIQGGLGLAARDWNALDQVCRYGAALGSAAGANCLGSAFRDGGAIGAPFYTDVPQSFAWHLFAARAGYHNSQYDLGWLLLSGRVPGVTKEQGEDDGLFWLRRAVELDHQYARKKLQEGGYAESEAVEDPDREEPDRFMKVVEIVGQLLRYLL
jgi:tetratricopeptide (TPR) repeat protein